eukprot:gene19799-biopygen6316
MHSSLNTKTPPKSQFCGLMVPCQHCNFVKIVATSTAVRSTTSFMNSRLVTSQINRTRIFHVDPAQDQYGSKRTRVQALRTRINAPMIVSAVKNTVEVKLRRTLKMTTLGPPGLKQHVIPVPSST